MSLLKKAKMGFSLLASKVTGRRFPLVAEWAITGRCNLRCTHCYGGYGEVQKEELTLDIVKKTVDELKRMGTKRIIIEGGEPLVREDIDEIIGYIHSQGIELGLCTNGVFLDKHIKFIKDKVDLVVLSLEGCEECHDSMRGQGNFRKVIHAIELCRENGMNTLIFACLVDRNFHDVDFLVDLAKKHGISVAFNIAVSKIKGGGAGREQPVKVDEMIYRDAFRRISEHKSAGAPVFYSGDNFLQVINWPDFSKEKLYAKDLAQMPAKDKKHLVKCYAGVHHCYIECTGNVYPCFPLVGEVSVKNLKKDGIKEAFRYLSELDYCRHCYNVTISELNLQSALNPKAVWKVITNYLKK